MPEAVLKLNAEEIAARMPMCDPFLFLQAATVRPDGAEGVYRLSGDEFFFKGHFRDNPIMPASLMLEALGQLAVLFLACGRSPLMARPADPKRIAFKSCDGVRCARWCVPGDTLTLRVKPVKIRHPFAVFEGHVQCGETRAAFAEEISLMFDYLPENL